MTPRALLPIVLLCAGCAPEPRPSRPPSEPRPSPPASESPPPGQPPPAAAPARATSRRIDVDFDGLDLADAMASLGRQVGATIVVDPNVRETIRVSLRDIPWREAVDVIARMCRCEVVEQEDGVLLITQP